MTTDNFTTKDVAPLGPTTVCAMDSSGATGSIGHAGRVRTAATAKDKLSAHLAVNPQ